jgi:hypothetical protein
MSRCVRTTIRLDDQLLVEAKALAARTGRTLTAVIEDALRQALAAKDRLEEPRPALPTFAGDGLQPGVDLDDTASLVALMEGER